MSNDGILPEEIVTDILSRIPVKSLCRFKSVSLSWKTLISDPHFARTHLNRTKTQNPKYLDQRHILISSYDHNFYSLDFADPNPIATKLDFPVVEQLVGGDWLKVWSSCDGLLLVSHNYSNFFLLNPSTRECKLLPTPPFRSNPVHWFYWYGFGLGYNSSTNDYNAVMLSCGKNEHAPSDIAMVDVYSVKTNAWSRVRDTQYVLHETQDGVSFNGCLHWRCQRTGSPVIGAFNLADHTFMEVPLPGSLRGCDLFDYCVEVVGGCLCLVKCNTFSENEVWLMEEYGVGESWTKLTINLPTGPFTLYLLCQVEEDKLMYPSQKFL